jgi:hypothetical protein
MQPTMPFRANSASLNFPIENDPTTTIILIPKKNVAGTILTYSNAFAPGIKLST